ncbi:MAG: hypothetical protein KKA84_00900 [Bacteroidetes bacterium]|nr:hypothetical protein [Bacteroidota bacterium]
MNEIISKPLNLNCGGACVHYLFTRRLKIQEQSIPDMYWAIEIASFIKNITGLVVKVYCYNSSLMNDYNKKKMRINSVAYKSIQKYYKSGGSIIIKNPEISFLRNICEKNFIIVCISLKHFYQDENLVGGHFIVIDDYCKGKFIIINPKRNKIVKEKVDELHLINSLNKFGNWIIEIVPGNKQIVDEDLMM